MLELLMFILGYSEINTINNIDYCKESRAHLTLEQKLEVSIGCSTVRGRRAYKESRLKWILNDGKPYDTELRLKSEKLKKDTK